VDDDDHMSGRVDWLLVAAAVLICSLSMFLSPDGIRASAAKRSSCLRQSYWMKGGCERCRMMIMMMMFMMIMRMMQEGDYDEVMVMKDAS